MPSLISRCPQPHLLPEWKVSPPNTCGSRALDFGLASLKVDCYLHPLTSPCHYIHKSQKHPDPVSAGKKQQGPDVTEIFVCLGCEALHVNQIEFAGKVTPCANSLLSVYHQVGEDGYSFGEKRVGIIKMKIQNQRIK